MANINQIGIPGVGTGILHPKQKNKWRVTFANIGGLTNSISLSLQAITVKRPTITFDEVQLDRYTSRAWVAGKYTFEPIDITFEDDINGSVATDIQAQIQTQQWLTGVEGQWLATAGEGNAYKFITYITQLDGNDQKLEEWIVEGCWFQSIDYTDLDYSVADAVVITVTIRYDHAQQVISKYSGGGVATGGSGKITPA